MLSKTVIAELDNTLLVDVTQFPVVSQRLLHEAVNSARDDDAADVRQLRECTTSILSAVHVLSARFESCIGGINDR